MKLPPLVRGRLVRRYKRFLADIELPGQGVVVCHCPNPGSMKNCAPEGAPAWVSRSDDPRRKLAHTWELVEVDGVLVNINTQRANPVVAEALADGVLARLRGGGDLRAEVACGTGARLDFAVEGPEGRIWIEVKSATLGVGDGVTAFPDSVTLRGRKHLMTLAERHAAGDRALLVFLAARADSRAVRPADEIDPAYGRALREAAALGVEVHAFRAELSLDEMRVGDAIPVLLD